MKHLEANNIICHNQFGFRSKHSCELQLLFDFAYALNNKLQVDIGILDFSKAFDKVPRTRLLLITEVRIPWNKGQAPSMD